MNNSPDFRVELIVFDVLPPHPYTRSSPPRRPSWNRCSPTSPALKQQFCCQKSLNFILKMAFLILYFLYDSKTWTWIKNEEFFTWKNVFSADGLLLLLVADVVGFRRDQVDKFGAAIQYQFPEKNQRIVLFFHIWCIVYYKIKIQSNLSLNDHSRGT